MSFHKQLFYFYFLSVLLLLSSRTAAQSSSDCIGALPFCSGPGQGKATVSSGDGNVHDETRLACVDNEGYSTWYTFTTTTAGIFRFVLTPVDQDDDYDWALFNITGNDCGDIPNDPDLLVSCNSWGDNNNNGTTGISTPLGGSGNQNGPGTTNGPPFNEDLQVQAGETYVLMVSNWSESTKGFNINVSGSTAQGVYRTSDLSGIEDQELCLGDTGRVNIDFTGTDFGLSYLWSPPELFVDPTVEDPIFNQSVTTTTEIELDFINGPCEYEKSMTFYVGTIDYDKQNKDQNVCVGNVNRLGIDFTGIVLPSGLKYHWTPEDMVDNPTSAAPKTIQLFDTTQFYFELRNGPCYAYDSLILFVHYDTVHAAFDLYRVDDENTIPIEVDFVNTSVGNAFNEWDFGDGTTYDEENPPRHEYPGYDTYEVQLVVKSPSTYCTDTARFSLIYPEVVYPNIISPNNDDYNDVLWITGLKMGTGITIYNRWGRVVYESVNYQHDWNADGLPDGVYYLQFSGEEESKKKGWIQVVR